MNRSRAALPVSIVAPSNERVPIYFGPAHRALFGWYHAPDPDSARCATAIVICPPLGHEYVNAHRSLRHLADGLAASGVPALRFDYDGTGDSAGCEDDPNRWAAWIASVREAVRAVRVESGCDRVGLVGLRMGATLAAVAACEIDVSCLVVWAPCVRGRTFLRELRALDLTRRSSPDLLRRPTEFEAAGFLATREIQRDVEAVDLAQITPRTRRVLIAARDDLPEAPGVMAKWASAGIAVDRQALPGYADMVVAPHNTRVPHAAIDYIVGWVVAGTAGPDVRRSVAAPDPSCVQTTELSLDDIRECVVRFGDPHDLFGIVSEPVGQRRKISLPAVVLSNAGSAHHVGPNRLYVSLARALARAGFICLRLDLPGLGDSVVDDPERENVPYVPEATAVIASAMEALSRRRGVTRFVIGGLCSGAHTAFHAAVDLDRYPIVESLLLNPLTFGYKPGMSLDASSEPHVTRWQRYRRSLFSRKAWTKLLQADLDLKIIARDVVTRVALLLRSWCDIRRLFWAAGPNGVAPTDLEAKLAQVAHHGRSLTLVFSRFDPGYDLLMINARQAVRALRRDGRLRTWFIAGANHTFDARGPRAELIRSVTTSLRQRYLGG